MAKPKKLKNGEYSHRFKVKNPINGKWVDKYVRGFTAQECYDKETKAKADALIGISPERINFFSFFDLWVNTFKVGHVGQDHLNKINSTRKTLLEFFGETILLQQIDRIKYQQWINYMGIDQNRAKKTVLDKHKIAKAVFQEAIDSNYLLRNPANKIIITGRNTEGEKKMTLNLEEWKKLRDVTVSSSDSASKYICLVMMYLGTRFSEAAGLLKGDFDFVNHTVSITKAFDYKRTKQNTRTKTAGSVRTIHLPKPLESIIEAHIAKLENRRKVVSLHSPDNIFLFTNEWGHPITNAALNKYLAKKCKQAGVGRITSHAFRHAKTDLLVLAGNDMIYTQKQLGHSDSSTTLKYYSSLNNDIKDKNNKIVDSFFENAK
ncbi:site-specific integrase [Enterococcus sp. BWM-S5]|uniref:Site-specific integrase n=1 Tax=Enterococcus larvae TaxID=2794352 RepID=A0ABS4CFT4_9ENTE|nr:site-specific integrase [Enterococcus larvae]MBP1045305.1 site-specific integrase [Enterococcus larvae]